MLFSSTTYTKLCSNFVLLLFYQRISGDSFTLDQVQVLGDGWAHPLAGILCGNSTFSTSQRIMHTGRFRLRPFRIRLRRHVRT